MDPPNCRISNVRDSGKERSRFEDKYRRFEWIMASASGVSPCTSPGAVPVPEKVEVLIKLGCKAATGSSSELFHSLPLSSSFGLEAGCAPQFSLLYPGSVSGPSLTAWRFWRLDVLVTGGSGNSSQTSWSRWSEQHRNHPQLYLWETVVDVVCCLDVLDSLCGILVVSVRYIQTFGEGRPFLLKFGCSCLIASECLLQTRGSPRRKHSLRHL